jgi:hypothetical protein
LQAGWPATRKVVRSEAETERAQGVAYLAQYALHAFCSPPQAWRDDLEAAGTERRVGRSKPKGTRSDQRHCEEVRMQEEGGGENCCCGAKSHHCDEHPASPIVAFQAVTNCSRRQDPGQPTEPYQQEDQRGGGLADVVLVAY